MIGLRNESGDEKSTSVGIEHQSDARSAVNSNGRPLHSNNEARDASLQRLGKMINLISVPLWGTGRIE